MEKLLKLKRRRLKSFLSRCFQYHNLHPWVKRRLHKRLLLAPVMRFFQILLHRQRAMKIASVPTPELATLQLKK